VALLPAQWQPIADKLQTMRASLATSQLVTLALTFVGVVGLLVGSAWYLNAPEYRVLYSDLSAESASQVVDRLNAANVSYELADGGRTVLVPAERLDTLRLQFAGEGVPVSGRMGFELFDRTAFGQTEFLEHVNYGRALEGELARTIETITEVQAARVHITMVKDSLFGAKEHPAKASVVLTLKGNRPLPPPTSQAIASLVAASVEGLRPEDVVLVDSIGRALSRGAGSDADGLAGADLEYQQKFERDLSTRVVALLEPVVGVDRVRVNVSARLHGDSEEQTEERWDPNPVVRSRQLTTESLEGQKSEGVAGARANLPPVVQPDGQPGPAVAPAATTTAASGLTRSAELTNYEVGKLTRHTVRARGELASVSVAVLVDDDVKIEVGAGGETKTTRRARDTAEMQKLQNLVAAAVGIDATRGDQITVENIAFGQEPTPVEPPVTVWTRAREYAGPTARVVALIVIVGMVLLLFVRPVVTRALALPSAGTAAQVAQVGMPQQLPRTVEDLEGEIAAQLDSEAMEGVDRRKPVLTRRVVGMATTEPANAAKLVRSWLAERRG
jgi:flagellar M-ring protein FliF